MEPFIVYLAVTFGVVLLFIHYFNYLIADHKKHHKQILSFSAGLSLAYIFLLLLPELYEGIEFAGKFLFVFVLMGTIGFHFAEKYIHQHVKKQELVRDLRIVHSIAFFTYHLMIILICSNSQLGNYRQK